MSRWECNEWHYQYPYFNIGGNGCILKHPVIEGYSGLKYMYQVNRRNTDEVGFRMLRSLCVQA